jgi:excinuclease ABC subunit B
MKKKSVQSSIKAGGGGAGSRVHKPDLDEMHGPESLPYRGDRALPEKPFGSTSRIIQPNDCGSRPGVRPEPPVDRRRAGKRGGWKKR